MNQRTNVFACTGAAIFLSLSVAQPCSAQTRWIAAPAVPQGATSSADPARVRSLPPPPGASGEQGRATPSMPAPQTDPPSSNIPRPQPDAARASFPQLPVPAVPIGSQPPAQSSPLANQPLNAPTAQPMVKVGRGTMPNVQLPPIPFPNAPNEASASTRATTVSNRRILPEPIRPSTPGTADPGADVTLADFEAAKLIAVVGTDHVLAGDLAGFVEPIIESNRDRFPDQATEDRVRMQLTRQVLKQYISIKAMYQEFFREMGGNASPEELTKMRSEVGRRAAEVFHKRQVPVLMKNYEVDSLRDLELKLREKSMSLITMKNQFIEQAIAQELESKYVPREFEVSLEELLQYYQSHASDWNVPARARWRQLTIRFDKHNSRQEVEQLIKDLGNRIYLGGASFEATARQFSEGYTAEEGGVYDWTQQGSLRSKPLDEAIFTLPLGRLSQVIEDDIGMHIIEVLEREPAHTKSFEDAQTEIRKILSEQKREEARTQLHKRVLKRTPVWSLWPDDIRDVCPHVRSLDDALGQ